MSPDYLKNILTYCLATGKFTWNLNVKRVGGREAGTHDVYGYVQISIKGKLYKAHRLAFLYVNGQLPVNEVDHINGQPGDNSWNNLREANRCQNIHNSKGSAKLYKNVYEVTGKRNKKYNVKFMSNGISKSYGYFADLNDAISRSDEIRKQLHGAFTKQFNKG